MTPLLDHPQVREAFDAFERAARETALLDRMLSPKDYERFRADVLASVVAALAEGEGLDFEAARKGFPSNVVVTDRLINERLDAMHRARVGALRARIAELTAECERRGDLISDYQIGHYCGDEYKAERTHEALMDYQVEPL